MGRCALKPFARPFSGRFDLSEATTRFDPAEKASDSSQSQGSPAGTAAEWSSRGRGPATKSFSSGYVFETGCLHTACSRGGNSSGSKCWHEGLLKSSEGQLFSEPPVFQDVTSMDPTFGWNKTLSDLQSECPKRVHTVGANRVLHFVPSEKPGPGFGFNI